MINETKAANEKQKDENFVEITIIPTRVKVADNLIFLPEPGRLFFYKVDGS